MLKGLKKAVAGDISLESQDSGKDIFTLVYKTLSSRFLLPPAAVVHPYELYQAYNGERTLPRASKELFQEVREILGYDSTNFAKHERIADHRCATVMRHRLDLLLALEGRPPILQPRDGCEFTLFYMVYCCLDLDQRNLTQWSDRDVDPEGLRDHIYFGKAWQIKGNAFAHLETAGFMVHGKMKKSAYYILHLHMDILRFQAYNKQRSENLYGAAIAKAEREITDRLSGLSSECYLRHCLTPNSTTNKLEYKKNFDAAASIALRWDPLSTSLDLNFFKHFNLEELIPSYNEFCLLKEQVDLKYLQSSSLQTPMYKLKNPSSNCSQINFVKWWKRITLEEIEAIPALEENKSLSTEHAGSMASLGKRLKKMAVCSEEPEVKTGKKRASSRKKGPEVEEEDVLARFMSTSMRKDRSAVKMKDYDMQDETLSLNSNYTIKGSGTAIDQFFN